MTKRYGNVSKYFRTLLGDVQQREEHARLEALLVEGPHSGGKDIPLSREFWKELRAEALEMAKHHRSRTKTR